MLKPPVVVSFLQQEVSFFYCPLSEEHSSLLPLLFEVDELSFDLLQHIKNGLLQ